MKKLLLLITIMISTLPQFCLAQDCSVSIDGPSSIFCPDESITLTAQTQGFDNPANVTYSWGTVSGGPTLGTTQTITLSSNVYTQTTTTFIVLAQGFCGGVNEILFAEFTVTVFSNFQLTGVAPAQAAICAGETISITATAIPNTNLTYSWAGPNGFALTNQTNATLTRNNANPNMSGTYTVTVTGQGGCFQTASTAITVHPQPAVNAAAADNTVCPTQQNLQLQATGSGGTEPYIFEWSGPNGFNNNTQNPAINNMPANAAGNYTVTLIDDNDCTATGAVNITANPLPTLSASAADNTVCPTQQNLQLQASGIGGANPYVFAWSGPNSFINYTQNPVINNMPASAAGNYTVTLTDANNCTATTGAVSVTANPLPNLSASAADNTVCPTQQNLQLQATGIGGANPYAFAWSGPNGFINNTQNPVINNMPASAAGNYTVTLTDANNCSATGSVLITANTLPTANITTAETSGIANNDGTVCAGAPATLIASGGTSYLWGNSLGTNNTITVNPTANTTYTVTVTNAQGCTANTGTTITATPLPSITFNTPTPNTACTAPFTGAVSISSPTGANYTYEWSNGAATTGISAVNSGDYTVTVTNTTTNCSNAATVNIPNNTAAPDITIADTDDPTSCGGNNGSITLGNLTSNFNYTVNYTKNGAPQTPFNTNASPSGQIVISGLGAGSYTGIFVTISGCQSNQVFADLSNPQAPTIAASSNSSVCVGSNIVLTSTPAGGSGIYNTYLWSGPNGYASLLQNPVQFAVTTTGNQTYTVAVTDSNGCTGSGSTTVTVNPAATANITVAETSGTTNNDGIICTGASATLTATGGNNYQWSNGSSGNSITVTPGTTIIYNVTITNAQGCSASSTKTITVETCGMPCPNPPGLSIFPQSNSNCGLVPQQFNIILSGGATSADISAIGSGIVSPTSISASGVVTYTPNSGDLGNQITITATTNDPDGAATACSDTTQTATVTYNAIPDAGTINGNNSVCLGGAPLTLTPTVTGGTWSSNDNGVATVAAGVVTAVAIGTATITYTITNATTGCQNSTTKVITVSDCACPNPAVVSVNPTNTSVCGTAPQTFTVTLSGGAISATIAAPNGAGNLSPTLLNGSGTFTYTPQQADFGDTVTLTITSNDPDGANPSCSATIETVELTFYEVPTVEPITGTDNVCVGDTIGLFSATPGGMWSSSNPAAATVNPSSGQVTGVAEGPVTITYTVIQNGCDSSQIKIVTVNPVPNANAGADQTICAGSPATLTASGAGSGGSYAWSNGSSGSSITVSPSATTTYSVTVTNSNGCTGTDDVEVAVSSSSMDIIGQAPGQPFITCINDTTYFLSFAIIGGTPPYWVNSMPLPAGSSNYTGPFLYNPAYELTLTDASGCSITISGVNTICGVDCTITAQLLPYPNNVCADGLEIAITGGPPQPPAYQYALNGGSWQQSPVFPWLPAGVYNVSVNTGCGATVIGTYTQEATPLTATIQISEFPQGSGLYQGSAAAVGGQPPYSIIWFNGQAGNFAQLGNFSGTGIVTITDATGCTRIIAFTQQGAVGIDITENELPRFTLYPNPANEMFVLSAPQPLLRKASVCLYSAAGQPIAQRQSFFSKPEIFDVQHLPAGLYFVKIVSDRQTQIFKVWCKGN